jgi:alkyldihydroxyacetonephosphate synthase
MKRLELDKTSMLISCPVDEKIAVLERQLRREGLTLGYHPVGRPTTIRKALEGRVLNRDALLYGGIDDLCVSLHAVRKGEDIVTRNVPRAATGPDFKKILIGSGRRYARLVKATLKVHPLPETRERFRLTWKSKKSRNAFLKAFWASGIRPVRFVAGTRAVTVVLEGAKDMVAAEKRCLLRMAHAKS